MDVTQILTTLSISALTALAGFLAGLLTKFTKREKARIIIEKASARAHVKAAYQKYVVEKHKLTIAAYDELLEEYEAYRLLGGNGTAKAYMEEIMELRPYLVTD
ncbi:MAG: hypothetical protein DBY20_03905 [Coriobacteriia bacterium]|nr:MAG: hypothetical protein DBY20_03905 [Coriobacteriia bacterium]